MASVNISALFENNLRRVSEVGVTTLHAVLANDGARLGTAPVYAKGGDQHLSYSIPADSIVPKFYFIVDEAFDTGTTLTVSTISGLALVTDLDLAVEGTSVSTETDVSFPVSDGLNLVLNQDVTQGKIRVLFEYISGSTNTGVFAGTGGAQ